ncbi:MAG: hypothetical protein OK454_08280, partial [Thaumarchaeota archaeon]|nr:hypothetical protein [Nitrososphaerota archaeon]
MGQSQLRSLATNLSVPSTQQSRFLRAASVLPNVKVTVDNVTSQSLTVALKRMNPVVEREAHIYAPKFPKPQNEGWFVVVGDLARDEVFAVKRVGWTQGAGKSVSVGSRPSARAVIKLPEFEGSIPAVRKVDVLVISDAYVGMQYE